MRENEEFETYKQINVTKRKQVNSGSGKQWLRRNQAKNTVKVEEAYEGECLEVMGQGTQGTGRY